MSRLISFGPGCDFGIVPPSFSISTNVVKREVLDENFLNVAILCVFFLPQTLNFRVGALKYSKVHDKSQI